MADVEYLKNFRPDLLSGTVDDMLRTGRLQDRVTLTEYLSQALNKLKTEPGPNLEYRNANADDWIGWWIRFLNKKPNPGILIPFEGIKNVLKKKKTSGALFGGKSEGHNGHRFAANWMISYVDQPILLLEREWYAESSPRGGRFIDLRAGISMWVYFNPKMIVSVMPQKDAEVMADVHYKKLFDQTGADYCFASRYDSLWEQKVKRGKSAPFLLIPDLFIQSTTSNVKRLSPGRDISEERTLINTTDITRRLLEVTTQIDFDQAVQNLDLTELSHHYEPELTKI